MTLSEVAITAGKREWVKTLAIALLTSLLSGGSMLAAVSFKLGADHQETQNRLTQLHDETVDIRAEQVNIKRDLASEHDSARDTAAALRALAEDLATGRAQTRARIGALETASQTEGTTVAAIEQSLVDVRETLRDLKAALAAHSLDLDAIRAAVAPRAGRR